MAVEITPYNPAPSLEEIRVLEKSLKLNLPREYQEFLLQYNIGKPDSNIIEVDGTVTSVSIFYGIRKDDLNDIASKHQTFSSRMPEGLIPIAEAGGGNQICLQVAAGAIFFWDHEQEAAEDEHPSYDNMVLLTPNILRAGAFTIKFDFEAPE